jgi:hypothetical protein
MTVSFEQIEMLAERILEKRMDEVARNAPELRNQDP